MKNFLCTTAALLSLIVNAAPRLAAQVTEPPPPPGVEQVIQGLVYQMTLEEKIDLLGGTDGFFVRAIPRLRIPRMKMADGPLGVRNFGPATAMAGGVGLAATWNTRLAERVGTEIGRDARAKGVHFLLGPGVNIYRSPTGGRNFEYFGEDPFLAARMTVGYVRGVQSQGVSATVKHLAANNSEFDRHKTDSVVDERTLREIYLPAFEAAVREARVGAIMSSYNLLNGEHASQNRHLLTEIVRDEWGFDGVMMSDWFATYDGVAAVNAGQDLEMPFAAHMNQKNLLPAIKEGKVSVKTIDEHVRRILRTAARFNWLYHEQTEATIPRFNQTGRQAALQAAREGMVLLKNDRSVLPLDRKKLRTVLVVGPNAYPAVPVGGGSARVEPFAAVSFMEGLSNALAPSSVNVYYHRGVPTLAEMAQATKYTTAASSGKPGLTAEYFKTEDLKGSPSVTRTEPHVAYGPGERAFGAPAAFPDGTLSGRWTGYFTPQTAGEHDVFVQATGEDGGRFRLHVDDKLVFDNWATSRELAAVARLTLDVRPHKVVLEQKGRSAWLGTKLRMGIVRRGAAVPEEVKVMAAKADAVVVAAGFDHETESEGSDRTFALPPGQDELIVAMAESNANTVVALTSGGGVDMTNWIERVPAVVQTWYAGQEGGTALAEILLGDVNPSGRLPVTFERRREDNPTHASYYPAAAGTNRVEYKEGVFVGYRGYEKAGTKPLFPFGHGLSYTTFRYSDLTVIRIPGTATNAPGAPDPPHYEVAFEVKNTGEREGAEVAQIYVSDTHAGVPRPPKELKGFAKVTLKPGESRRVAVRLDSRSLSYYDAASKQWRAEPGDFQILVGRSSEQIELRGKLTHQ
ncbi:MAG: glycoside hydrolase family 3 C-terminal domain-containing protein [Acidobacteria bacterium]|nr:glycoside hydrolase family 3 C-terminal domain-containing protein [Acidobacteriota bacterium]